MEKTHLKTGIIKWKLNIGDNGNKKYEIEYFFNFIIHNIQRSHTDCEKRCTINIASPSKLEKIKVFRKTVLKFPEIEFFF
jgi:hypothetical protein